MRENSREERGRAIASASDQVQRIDGQTYRVKSQNGNGAYSVVKEGSQWECSCPDHIYRDARIILSRLSRKSATLGELTNSG